MSVWDNIGSWAKKAVSNISNFLDNDIVKSVVEKIPGVSTVVSWIDSGVSTVNNLVNPVAKTAIQQVENDVTKTSGASTKSIIVKYNVDTKKIEVVNA